MKKKNEVYFNNNQIVKPQVRNRRDADKLIQACYKTNKLLTLTVLHDKFGFGKKRLERFLVEYDEILDSVGRGYLDKDDLYDTLYKETGVKAY